MRLSYVQTACSHFEKIVTFKQYANIYSSFYSKKKLCKKVVIDMIVFSCMGDLTTYQLLIYNRLAVIYIQSTFCSQLAQILQPSSS